jgi:glycosyltransferase involved in cell wall biosynthesis
MKSCPGFSVLMAVYKKDNPYLFSRALKSVFENTVQPRNFILVCDGPLTVDLDETIAQYKHKDILKIIKLPKNIGLFGALNHGLNFIQDEFTIRADSDDYNFSNRFEILLSVLDEGYDIVGSWIREVDQSGAQLCIRNTPLKHHDILKFIKKRNPFNHMSVGFRTEVVKSVRGYPSIYLREDYALWAILLSQGFRSANITNLLVDATAGEEMYKRRGGLKYALGEIDMQRLLYKLGFNSFFESLYYGFGRSSIFLLPNSMRKYFYLLILRRNI